MVKWQVIEEEGPYGMRLYWAAKNSTLTMTGTCIQDARGLTPLSKQLLKQRGAVGEPEQEASKLIPLASVVSKLKEP
jgi:hypothetical protein